jgi:2-polyprenyl-3-methyl-5-hydroxy-6-metoxy-1,4-benzoquinol methylase
LPPSAAASASPETRFKRAYTGARPDLLALVPPGARRILDVGCATGAFGGAIKAEREGAVVVGVEADPEMAGLAVKRLDRVLTEPIEQALEALAGERFDCIVCGDVLEHLADPWGVLRALVALLDERGSVVASLPNAGHLDTLVNLSFRRRWPYRERGIHDETHLRFFALANVRALFAQAGLEIVALRRHYRIVERPHRLNRLAPLLAVPGLRELVAFQYLVRAVPGRPSPPARWTLPSDAA